MTRKDVKKQMDANPLEWSPKGAVQHSAKRTMPYGIEIEYIITIHKNSVTTDLQYQVTDNCKMIVDRRIIQRGAVFRSSELRISLDEIKRMAHEHLISSMCQMLGIIESMPE